MRKRQDGDAYEESQHDDLHSQYGVARQLRDESGIGGHYHESGYAHSIRQRFAKGGRRMFEELRMNYNDDWQ